MEGKLLYKPSEVANLIGFGRSKTYEMITDGTLPRVRVGASIRITRQDLEQWVDSLRDQQVAGG